MRSTPTSRSSLVPLATGFGLAMAVGLGAVTGATLSSPALAKQVSADLALQERLESLRKSQAEAVTSLADVSGEMQALNESYTALQDRYAQELAQPDLSDDAKAAIEEERNAALLHWRAQLINTRTRQVDTAQQVLERQYVEVSSLLEAVKNGDNGLAASDIETLRAKVKEEAKLGAELQKKYRELFSGRDDKALSAWDMAEKQRLANQIAIAHRLASQADALAQKMAALGARPGEHATLLSSYQRNIQQALERLTIDKHALAVMKAVLRERVHAEGLRPIGELVANFDPDAPELLGDLHSRRAVKNFWDMSETPQPMDASYRSSVVDIGAYDFSEFAE